MPLAISINDRDVLLAIDMQADFMPGGALAVDGGFEDLRLDTYADERRFFSYRRATHRKEPDYGRLLSVIVMN